MPKKQQKSRPKKQSLVFLAVCGLIFLSLAGAILYVGTRPSEKTTTPPTVPTVPDGKQVIIKGELTCLLHKGNPPITTDECAYGLKADDGQYYSLRDADPQGKTLFDAPFHTPVSVKGTLETEQNDRYETVGSILVQEIIKN